MDDNQDYFNVLRKVNNKPKSMQIELAEELGFNLGKINYCLNFLKQKSLVKIKSFRKNPNTINYFYVLTLKGIASKTKLAINFMRLKMKEYDKLKQQIKGSKYHSFNYPDFYDSCFAISDRTYDTFEKRVLFLLSMNQENFHKHLEPVKNHMVDFDENFSTFEKIKIQLDQALKEQSKI